MLLSPAGGAEVGAVDEWTERARKIQPRRARGETRPLCAGRSGGRTGAEPAKQKTEDGALTVS